MLSIPFLLLTLITPFIFWRYGKRLLGNQTHPAALFILAWIVSSLLLGFADSIVPAPGQLAFLWVSFNFAVFVITAKMRQASKSKPQ